MAEERDDLLPEFDDNEEDVLFQFRMKVYDLFMAHWKNLLIISGIFLLIVLVQGLYTEYVQEEQREIHRALLEVKTGDNFPEEEMIGGISLNFMTPDELEALKNGALEMEKIAEKSKGVAVWFAWMEAAKTWERADSPDSQIVALQKAASLDVGDELKSSATLQLANAYQENEKGEQAIQTLETFIASSPAYGLERAQINLALFYEEAGNIEKMKEVLQTIAQDPVAPNPEVAMLLERVE